MKFIGKLEKIKLSNPNKKICIIIGDPVKHSLSPAMHNSAYKIANLGYIFDRLEVKENELEEFVVDLKEFNKKNNGVLVGLTCTMPHKINIIQYLDELKEEAKQIKAVNSVFFDGIKYIGYNTDWYGIERPFLERNIDLNSKKIAIIGAGGASRACIYTFKVHNCEINIFNRTIEKAENLANEFGCKAFNLYNNDDKIENCDIIVNMTNVGMGVLEEQAPINTNILNKNHVVFECIYSPKETKLIKESIKIGANVIYGWEMLLYQGVEQFKFYTGIEPNINIMKEVLL